MRKIETGAFLVVTKRSILFTSSLILDLMRACVIVCESVCACVRACKCYRECACVAACFLLCLCVHGDAKTKKYDTIQHTHIYRCKIFGAGVKNAK